LPHRAADLGEPGEQVLGRDIFIPERARDLLGRVECVDEFA
jgi:hypothetical protein